MARLLVDAIWISQALGVLPDVARIAYVTLLLMTDTGGNGAADCARIKCNAYAYRDDIRIDDIQASLNELEGAGLIKLYEVDGVQYYHVVDFEKVQHFKWPKHTVPLPDGTAPEVANMRERRAPSKGKASTSSEDEDEVEKEADADADADAETKSACAESGEAYKSPYALPLKGGRMYIPSLDDIERLQRKYFSRDLEHEFGLMRDWLRTCKSPFKSESQADDFIQRWLLRAGNVTNISKRLETEDIGDSRNAWMQDYC